jgi:hypothetical protein
VKHFASPKFWAAYEALPAQVRELAKANYGLHEQDPRHPSLQFKKVGRYWSLDRHSAMRRRDKIASLFCAQGAGPESIEPLEHLEKWIPGSHLRCAPE